MEYNIWMCVYLSICLPVCLSIPQHFLKSDHPSLKEHGVVDNDHASNTHSPLSFPVIKLSIFSWVHGHLEERPHFPICFAARPHHVAGIWAIGGGEHLLSKFSRYLASFPLPKCVWDGWNTRGQEVEATCSRWWSNSVAGAWGPDNHDAQAHKPLLIHCYFKFSVNAFFHNTFIKFSNSWVNTTFYFIAIFLVLFSLNMNFVECCFCL